MSTDLTLMHLMCAKICHDLAAPLGAISLGLEMLADSSEPTQGPNPTLDLIHYSTQAAISKLELFRCLTGFASIPEKPTGMDLKKALQNYGDDRKITLSWQIKDWENLKGPPIRLILGAILTASSGLPRGGTLTIHPNFSITAQGPGAHLREDISLALLGQSGLPQQCANTIVAFFASVVAQNLGGKFRVETLSPDQFQIQMVTLD